jgi:hypothetical protein
MLEEIEMQLDTAPKDIDDANIIKEILDFNASQN